MTTLCTAEEQTNLHLSLRVRHPLLVALDVIRQYTQDSTNDSFDFDRVMEYYDGMIINIVTSPLLSLCLTSPLPYNRINLGYRHSSNTENSPGCSYYSPLNPGE